MKKLFSFILLSAAMMMSGSAWAADAPEPDYLTFTNKGSSTASINIVAALGSAGYYPNLYYTVDGGKSWTELTEWQLYQQVNVYQFSLAVNASIKFKGTNQSGFGIYQTTKPNDFPQVTVLNLLKFNIPSGNVAVSGNIMSLIDGKTDGSTLPQQTTMAMLPGSKTCAFPKLFENCTGLTDASRLQLPAKTLVDSCYAGMFYECTNLTKAPVLPATTLAQNCYREMFRRCSIETAPKLPATTLARGCYQEMFRYCASLVNAPELPATGLVHSCYESMFEGCTSLENAPVLPATTLTDSCYQYMFSGCTRLAYVKCLATGISAKLCTFHWVYGVAAEGTFVKAAGATWPEGVSGIPSGWKQEEVSILDDSKEYDYDKFKETSSLEMNRTFKHNGTNHTICLPFDLSASQFASSPLGAGCTKLQTFGSAAIKDGTLEVTMVDVSTKAIEAGKPYLIAWENDGEDVVCPVFNNITFEDIKGDSIVKGDVAFHGLLGPQSVTVDDESVLFVGATGNLNWPNAGSQINGYRCYFKVKTTNSPIRRGMNAVLAEGRTTPTGMNQVTGDRLQVTGVEKLIEAGKVVIISDGVRYNLNGQIIK